jgi:hypothetical protein
VVGGRQDDPAVRAVAGDVLVPERQEPPKRSRPVRPVGVEEAALMLGEPPQRTRATVVEQRRVRGLVHEEEVAVEARAQTEVDGRLDVALGQQDGVGVGLVQPVGQITPQRCRRLAVRVALDQ